MDERFIIDTNIVIYYPVNRKINTKQPTCHFERSEKSLDSADSSKVMCSRQMAHNY